MFPTLGHCSYWSVSHQRLSDSHEQTLSFSFPDLVNTSHLLHLRIRRFMPPYCRWTRPLLSKFNHAKRHDSLATHLRQFF
nr:uncharacterized protein CTRU02_06424 [Colletotrichum truncatum]KAF6792928.1 hypothetical protein CTRU02_06424 [Colletotrichum truncatum]